MVTGFVLVKVKAVPDNCTQVIFKLENNVFIPALVVGAFIVGYSYPGGGGYIPDEKAFANGGYEADN